MGLIKTAMIGGAAMYGVRQIAKAAEGHHTNNNNDRSAMTDSDYRDYLEWKTNQRQPMQNRGTTSRGLQHCEDQSFQGGQEYRQQPRQGPYYLTNEEQSNMMDAPMFRDYQNDKSRRYDYQQPPAYDRPRQNHTQVSSGFVDPTELTEGQERGFESGSRSQGLNALIDQGIQTFQSQGGKLGGKNGELLKKLVK